MEGDDLGLKSVDREVRTLIKKAELVEKSRVVSIVELRELLALLRDWVVSVVELRELLALLRDWFVSVVELREWLK